MSKQQEVRHYFDREAEIDINGKTKKCKFTGSPLVTSFEFVGTNGYWNGNHRINQTEDCINCLKVMFGEKYETVFLLITPVAMQRKD